MKGDAVGLAYREIVSRWRQAGTPERAALLERFKADFAYQSGHMENPAITLHDTREIFDHGRVVSYTGDVRTLFEIENLRRAWEWSEDFVAHEHTLTEDALLDLHRILTLGTYDEARIQAGERPGTYKRGNYGVGADIGYYPEEVESATQELIDEVNQAMGAASFQKNALTVGSYAHAVLVDIHPFADGNGRLSRQLMNTILLAGNHPPINIREQDRIAYFGALDAFHDGGDLDPFRQFLTAECVMGWQELIPTPSTEEQLEPAPEVEHEPQCCRNTAI